MQIIENKALLFRTRNPDKYSIIPKHKVLEADDDGVHEVAVYWGLDEARVLHNLGVKNVPSPITKRYSWPGRYRPMQHQIDTAAFLTMHRRAFCFNDPGTGKTMSALWAADYLIEKGYVRRVLVLCPLSIMQSAWMQDLNNAIMHRSAVVAHHTQSSRRIEMIQQDYTFVITNYDGLALVAQEIINDGRFDLIIVDEANCYKNATTNRWKALASIIKPETYLWMMTGTPASQSPVDAYGLARLVNPGGIPKYLSAWRDMTMHKITQFKWAPKPNAAELVFDALQPAIRFTKAQCLDLPPVITVTRDVPMTPQQSKYYRLLKEQMMVKAAGETISAVNAGVAVSKLLQISCIAYNTPVLTDKGWVPIQNVRDSDLVWDGTNFVQHGGLLPRGKKAAIKQYGVWMTPDHEVLTYEGWRKAAACDGLDRAKVRLPNGAVKEWYERWGDQESALAVPVRLRKHSGTGEPVFANETPPIAKTLRVPTRKQNARNDAHTPVSHMDKLTASMLEPVRQGLEKLRWAGDQCLCRLAAKLRQLLVGHEGHVPEPFVFGSYGQQRPVWQTELSLGKRFGAIKQHTQHSLARYSEGAHDVGTSRSSLWTSVCDAWGEAETLWVAAGKSFADTREIEVFDIAHCGPQNRFVVQGDDGQALIVHNCGAAYTDDREVVEFDASPRLAVLEEVLQETKRKVLIFAMFRSSIDAVATYLNKKGYPTEQIQGDVSPAKRNRIIHDFQTTDNLRVLVLQPAAAAHGLTLTAADTVIFYGPLMSVEMYTQCIARADRKGQDSDKVTVVHLQSSHIEREMFKAMNNKVSEHALLVNLFNEEIKS